MERTFGETLRDYRLKADVGLRELSRIIGKSPGYLSDVENGRVPPPSEEVIVKIAAAIMVDKAGLLALARKVDPEISDYMKQEPQAADFLRMAKDQEFNNGDWKKLSLYVKRARLGKGEEEDK